MRVAGVAVLPGVLVAGVLLHHPERQHQRGQREQDATGVHHGAGRRACRPVRRRSRSARRRPGRRRCGSTRRLVRSAGAPQRPSAASGCRWRTRPASRRVAGVGARRRAGAVGAWAWRTGVSRRATAVVGRGLGRRLGRRRLGRRLGRASRSAPGWSASSSASASRRAAAAACTRGRPEGASPSTLAGVRELLDVHAVHHALHDPVQVWAG